MECCCVSKKCWNQGALVIMTLDKNNNNNKTMTLRTKGGLHQPLIFPMAYCPDSCYTITVMVYVKTRLIVSGVWEISD